MSDKAKEIVNTYLAATNKTTISKYKSSGKPGEILTKHNGEAIKHSEYRSILGKIMFYCTKVGLECSFACGQLARHMHNPGNKHWDAMRRMVGYIYGKEKHELII